jgi:pimeloyl-ACP methyl ester carboxylesterase
MSTNKIPVELRRVHYRTTQGWGVDKALLDRPGNGEIQLAMLYDYRTKLPLYPKFQAFFREYKPPTLIVWGNKDFLFPTEGDPLYKRDLPNAEIHSFDTGTSPLRHTVMRSPLI